MVSSISAITPAGNLKSGSQIVVVQEAPQVIVIQPANTQVVYVPVYNPTVVYGYPYTTPGYSAATVATTAVVAFGVGIAVGAMMSNNSCCGWGYSSWNCNWHGGALVYGSSSYYGNAAWHGGYYGSSGSAYGPYGSAHASSGYNPSTGTYALAIASGVRVVASPAQPSGADRSFSAGKATLGFRSAKLWAPGPDARDACARSLT